jgi:putative ABC transport system permease protein
MWALSWTTLRDRWQLFVGAILTVALAVALTQASLLALVSAATADVPSGLPEIERLAIREGYEGAAALLGIVVGIAFFVSIFIVSSTFAFVVAQRRRDMALLRLVGAARRQVRRLLIGESVMVGVVGTCIGIPTGVLVAGAQDHLLVGLDLVPEGFQTEWRTWIISVSCGVGIVVAVLAAWGAAFRAGRVRPLEALRGGLRADRVMTASRWAVGFLAFGGAIAMMIVAPLVGPDGGLAVSMNVAFVLVVALAAWSPVVVPPIAGLLAILARVLVPRSALRELVAGNVRTGVRRTASTATPIVVLVGLVVGLGGGLALMQEGIRIEAAALHTSDVIAVSDRGIDGLLATMPDVVTYSTSTDTVVHVMAADNPATEDLRDTSISGRAVEPATYLAAHHLLAERGDLDRLADGAVVLTADLAGRMGVEPGDTTSISVGGQERQALIGAILPLQLNAVAEILVPIDLIDGSSPDAFGTRETAIITDDVAGTGAVIASLRAAGVEAHTTPDAIAVLLDDADRQNRSIQVALLGMSALLAMVAIVNSVVVAASDRREEFAALRLTGLTRSQVIRAALAESGAVVATGTLLGSIAAAGTAICMSAVVTALVDERVVAVPWTLWGLTIAAVTVAVGVTTLLTATAMTRADPIAAAGARE